MKKTIITGIILLLVVIVYILISISFENKEAEEYYSNNIVLSGVIAEKKFLEKDDGIYYIDIVKCNVNNFDLRPLKKSYNLIVKEKKAEFLFCGYRFINVGDSVIVNLTEKSARIKRLNDTIINYKFGDVLYSKWYAKKIKTLHKL